MKKITETNCDKKEGICEHYIPHYIKREGGFRYCEAGHCSLHERNGILIDGDKNICKLFAQYTASCEMVHVKTSNMGSLYKLHYRIRLKEEQKEKEFIDKLRCRNGNLEISCGRALEEERL